jgi:RNA polymerase sigma factor (sigma-70 family)
MAVATQRVESATRLDGQLFERHACQLRAVVGRRVSTSPANVEDACAFAWLQLVRRRPAEPGAFAWLCTTAIREAIRLCRRAALTDTLDEADETAADPRDGLHARLELIAAGQQIRRVRLRPREARLVGLRAAAYRREEMAEVTGESCRTVDRQLGRAQRKLRHARRAVSEVR